MKQNIEYFVCAYFNIPQRFLVANISDCFEHMVEEICLNVEKNKHLRLLFTNSGKIDLESQISCEIFRKIKFNDGEEKEYQANLDDLKDFVHKLLETTDILELSDYKSLEQKWLKTTQLYKKFNQDIHQFIINSCQKINGKNKIHDEDLLFFSLTDFFDEKKGIIKKKLVDDVMDKNFSNCPYTANFIILD